MTDTNEQTNIEEQAKTDTEAVSSTYKILGKLSAKDGVGVLGQNNASTGTPIGVQGAVPNSGSGYGLSTPDDARINGDIESSGGHTLTVDGLPTLTLGTTASDGSRTAGGNVIAGYKDNSVQNDSVGATISGGGASGDTDLGGSIGVRDNTNEVLGNYGTIGGGYNNRTYAWCTIAGGINNTSLSTASTIAGGDNNISGGTGSTVGGGSSNNARSSYSTVGGGNSNTASAEYATVPGGENNVADGSYSFAAGRKAKMDGYRGSFVWADSRDQEFKSNGQNQFIVQADGGVGLGTNTPFAQLHIKQPVAGSAFNNVENHVAIIENTADDTDGVDETKANTLAIRGGPSSDPDENVNFISFYDGSGGSTGAIEGDGSGGSKFKSSGSDYAECLPRADADVSFEAGDVVGVRQGELVADAAGADRAMVVSDQHIVLGNDPGETESSHESVAFTGQVPVRVRGTVEAGDIIVPSGDADGTAIAIEPSAWNPDDAPIVGQAWKKSDDKGVSRVTVAVGIDDPTLLGEYMAAQQTRIDELEAENERKEKRIDELEQRLANLEAHVDSSNQVPADD